MKLVEMKLVIILNAVLLGSVFTSRVNEIKMLSDVICSLSKPSNVLAHLCWNSFEKRQLMSHLASVKNPKSVQFLRHADAKKINFGETVVVIVDTTCPHVNIFLDQANSKKKFGKPYRWFVLQRSATEGIPSQLDNLHILADSEVYVMKINENNSYAIDLVYKIRPGRDWISEHYGTWTIDGLNKTNLDEESAAARRKNLAGETVVTSVVVTDNSTIADLYENRFPLIDTVTKSLAQQLIPLYHFMNATSKLIYTDGWGAYSNGSWNGMVGDMAHGRAELAGSLLFVSKERMDIQEYLTYPSPLFLGFMFREPPLSYQNNLFLLPFKASVWYCCGSFVLLMIVVILFNAKWEARKTKKKYKNMGNKALMPSLSEVAVFVVSAITQQGSTVELKGSLGRLVIFILFLAFLFLYTAYSASIVVLLQSTSNQIKTLGDLLQSKIELGVEDTVYNKFWFSVEKEPIRKALYEKKIAPKGSTPRFYSLEKGIGMMQIKPFAFHMNPGVGYHIMERLFHEHEKCGLHLIPFIQNSSPWSSCSKKSPYKEIFKMGLMRVQEHGINDRINKLIFAKKPVCSLKSGHFVSVSLVDCYPSLLVLLYGLILAVLLLVIEILYHRRVTGFCCNEND